MRLAWALALVGAVGCSKDAVAPGGFADMAHGGVPALADMAVAATGGSDLAMMTTMPGSDGGMMMTGTCGTCPTGYTCGSANGIAVCRAPSGIPLFTHVFLMVMENTSWDTLQGDSPTNTPNAHALITSAAHGSDYHGVTHPSLPNYLAMTSGSPGVQMDGTTAVSCDCDPVGSTCSSCGILSTCGCVQQSMHIGDQLEAATKSWRAYADGMGTACNLTKVNNYVPRHVPFLYYNNVQTNAARCTSHVVDYSSLTTDLGGTQAPQLMFIAPDLVHDMHGTALIQLNQAADLKAGDMWLGPAVKAITDSAAYKQGGVLFIVWDEDDLSGVFAADDPIPLFVLSPLAKSGGFESTVKADHYSLLATMEDGLAVARLGNAATATPLTDYFPAN